MANRDDLVGYLNERLRIDAVEDLSENGLQVQGVQPAAPLVEPCAT